MKKIMQSLVLFKIIKDLVQMEEFIQLRQQIIEYSLVQLRGKIFGLILYKLLSLNQLIYLTLVQENIQQEKKRKMI